MRLAFNVNNYVWVKLRKEGYQIWKDYYDKVLPPAMQKPLDYYTSQEKDGYVNFQLHEFMGIFGNHNMGCLPPYWTELEFEFSDLKEPTI